MKKKILVFTGSRADFGILNTLILKIKKDNYLKLIVFAGPNHFQKKTGFTNKEIKKAKFKIDYSQKYQFKKLNEKAQMLSRESRDIEVSSIPQFEQSQALSMEIAGLHQEFKKFVESYGFDSIQYVNQVEPSFTTDADNLSYILFKPEQWKSVSARRFDPNDKRFG